ncbi:sigma-70 family RNA polymerase sigma factor [Frankia sp. Cpl3]|uniref:RNA polymerase sigma factor n=1 Tax=Parafrankia colletiae TaxID=573497 RepID=UPI000ADF3DD2|nr:sigma-70 family RNA polymerase sigma factor [Parafrankia colletiae]MCK9901664.1 sigma-70 family RNA polymerase sigma factor [Frankia sp. Cpl3]
MPPRSREQAFEALFRAHQLAVLRFAQRRLSDDAAAWDVVSETFLTVWRSWENRPTDSGETLPWLYAIAGNAVRNRHRSDVRVRRLTARLSAAGSVAGPAPATDVVAHEAVARDHARWALDQLSDRDREILTLAVWEKLDLPGLAATLGISPAAAKMRLHRARRHLQDLIAAPPLVPAPSSVPGRRS